MEVRAVPPYTRRAVPVEKQTDLEVTLGNTLQQVEVKFLGIPWINPVGRSKDHVSHIDLINSTVHLRRVLAVAFRPSQNQLPPDVVVVACSSGHEAELLQAVESELVQQDPDDPNLAQIVWWHPSGETESWTQQDIDELAEKIKQKGRP